MARRWSRHETQAFLDGIGTAGIAWLRRRGGAAYGWPHAPKERSRAAVYQKARRLYGGGGVTRGAYSVRAACRLSGYDRSHLRRAQLALAQKWRRTTPGGRYLIYEDQLDDVLAWLAHDYWSKRHRLHVCLWCGLGVRPHKAAGLCVRCCDRYFTGLARAGLPRQPGELLIRVRAILGDSSDWPRVERSLQAGRALPESVVREVIHGARV